MIYLLVITSKQACVDQGVPQLSDAGRVSWAREGSAERPADRNSYEEAHIGKLQLKMGHKEEKKRGKSLLYARHTWDTRDGSTQERDLFLSVLMRSNCKILLIFLHRILWFFNHIYEFICRSL